MAALGEKVSHQLIPRQFQVASHIALDLGQRANFQLGMSWDGDAMLRAFEL